MFKGRFETCPYKQQAARSYAPAIVRKFSVV
jgi:hypothetical protein